MTKAVTLHFCNNCLWVVLHVMAWALLPNARPPYNQSVFRNHAVVCREEKSGRVESVGGARGGTCAADTSWRYAWREKGETAQPALTGKELCQLLPDGAQVLSMGDSISEQLLSSWRARLFTAGINHPQRAMVRNTVCKDAPLTRFYHVEVWAWVLEGSAQFESSDSRTEDCAAELRRQPSAFGLKVVSRAALREIVANATEVVFSTFDHLSPVLDAVEACYSKQLGVAARRSAARDVLRYWAREIADVAKALARPSMRRLWYRTSAPGSERWVRPTTRQHQPQAVPQERTPSDGNGSTLLPSCADVAAATDGKGVEYWHELFSSVNDVSAAAFRAAGGEVIDQECMLGVRTDAHPASHATNGRGDALHFCLPGPQDHALDHVLRTLYPSRFDHVRLRLAGV